MKTRYDDTYVECPFYKGSNKMVITCEGVGDDHIIHLSFSRIDGRNQYKSENCDDSYKLCPVYQMLMRKYEKEDSL